MHLLFDFWRAVSELIRPELVDGVAEQLDEDPENAPWMRAKRDNSFEEDSEACSYKTLGLVGCELPCDLLADRIRFRFAEQQQNDASEEVGVRVRVTQLVG